MLLAAPEGQASGLILLGPGFLLSENAGPGLLFEVCIEGVDYLAGFV